MRSEFEEYQRKQISELRPLTETELTFNKAGLVKGWFVSVSQEDEKAGSPKEGDMIARNPKNHKDQWLVSKEYVADNFVKIKK